MTCMMQVQEMFMSKDLPNLSIYETHVETCQFQLNSDPNNVIYGKITINRELESVAQIYSTYFQNVNSQSHKVLQQQFIFAKKYFSIDSDQNLFSNQQSVTYKLHQVAKSPVPLIVAHRQLFLQVDLQNHGDQILFSMKSIDNDFCDAQKNAVTGNCKGIIIKFVKQGDQTTVSQYFWIDPNGNIPAKIYNLGLNQSNDFLLLLKKCCEGAIKLE
ncbi:hypothetical protein SS50377_23283 [Spironucleus salmonicida]|uniref:START domain-containing protein n=1 Tax=Spironucleus salmonicida TaxID=348837 RepID=V6LTW1_9EUKA|nr:hypothetical protein SS50377_23283 [Spironucleus salmonicida]|eukprot:EST47151.1 Hypothetical protein SS50377_12662 [Spironucleus salmonicida]